MSNVFLFRDLARSNFVTIFPNLTKSEILAGIQELELSKGDYKFIFDNYSDKFISEIVAQIYPTAKIKDYDSNFFIFREEDLEDGSLVGTDLDWDYYAQDFFSIPVMSQYKNNNQQISEDDESEMEILLDFLQTSFGSDFERKNGKTIRTENILKSQEIEEILIDRIQNPNMKTYFLMSKEGQLVGTYSLTKVGTECQLSAVAGMISDEEIAYTDRKKLPIISAAFIKDFLAEDLFSHCDKLTFSNSKKTVADYYRSLDIPENTDRKGIFVSIAE